MVNNMFNNDNMITDTESSVRYKILDKNGNQIGIEKSKHLAEMRVNSLPEELKEGCDIILITEDDKQVLFG